MKIEIAQINTTVGDIDGNTESILQRIEAARRDHADLIVFPELAIFGYPPQDLVMRDNLISRNLKALDRIAKASTGIATFVGYVQLDPTGQGKGIFNAAACCQDGRVVASYAKMLLPTYDVFDESRYFNPGIEPVVVPLRFKEGDCRVAITICEDAWHDEQFGGRKVYGLDPIGLGVAAGADLIINLSGSPFRVGIQQKRETIFTEQAKRHQIPLVYCNLVGGNDDLLFDGASLVIDRYGKVIARGRAFVEDTLAVDLSKDSDDSHDSHDPRICDALYPSAIESVRAGLVMGIRDYVQKCGFDGVLVGVSGGIDSALTIALAVEALGANRVRAVSMPSRYSSDHSRTDAKLLAENLDVTLIDVAIHELHSTYEQVLKPHFDGSLPDVTEENIQARIRGDILMSLSNKFGWLLLTTGNKSELAVGYCTLYGDMCGGLAVLSDVPKTTVYDLAKHINETSGRAVIPVHTISKPPSAELRENQADQDTLPPYDVLDAILEQYVEHELSVDTIIANGFDQATVTRVADLVDRNEYKRKQIPVGLKVTSRAFGTGRRMPIAAKFR